MDRYELIEAMERNRDPIKAVQMEKYMKDQFKFLGLQSVKRRDISRPFLASLKKSALDWQLVFFCGNNLIGNISILPVITFC